MESLSTLKPSQHPADDVQSLQAQIYSKMSFRQKWEEVYRLRELAWSLKKARLQQQHPDWNDQKIEAAVRKIFIYATT